VTTLKEHLASLGRKGGKARAKNLTPQERSESAKKAINARWAKLRAEVKEIKEGTKRLEKKALAAAKKAAKKRLAPNLGD
jgi:hypothetical protein